MPVEGPTPFLHRLRESQLLEPAQLEELAALPEAKDADPHALARVVFKRGWLTRYQLNQVGQGKARDLKVGPYLILDRLGEGGMGQVFKAHHQHMRRTVALKVIRKERLDSPDAVKRFYQEVQAAAQLVNPHIVLAYDAGPAGNTHYFAMELVEGIDLARLVKESGPLPVALACEYIRQAALGLQHAFEKGLVHRDIKPANLLLGEAGKDGRKGTVKILDMGLARFRGGEREKGLTQTGQVIGTPDYLAPEQALDSRQADTRADIYSLGCSLYFLLAGKAPFQGETLAHVLLQHQMEQAPPVPGRSDVPAALQTVLARMMAKKPDDRYQTPAEVVEALEPFSRGETAGGEESVFAAIAETAGKARAREYTLGGDEPAARKAPGVTTVALPAGGRRKGKQPDNKRALVLAAATGSGVVLLLGLVIVVWLATRGGGPAVALGTGQTSPGPRSTQKDRNTGKASDPVVKATRPQPVADPLVQGLPPASGKSPLDKLDPAKVPVENRHADLPDLVAVLKGHAGEVWSICFSGDGKRILTGSGDQTARLWDVTGEEPRTIATVKDQPGGVDMVALTPNGQAGVTGSKDRSVHVWDFSGAEPRSRATLPDHVPGISSLALSPDGKTLAFPVGGGEIHLFNLGADKPQEAGKLPGHQQPPVSLSFTRDGKTLASVSEDRTARLWDLTQMRPQQKKIVPDIPEKPSAVALSPDAQKLVVGFHDGHVRLWDISAEPRELAQAKEHVEFPALCFFSPDGESYFSVGAGWNAGPRKAVWCNSKDGTKRKEWNLPERIACGAISPDGHYLALTCHDRNAYILRLPNGEAPKVAALPPPMGKSPLDKLDPAKVPAENRHPGFKELVAVLKGHTGAVFGVSFSGDGKRLISGGDGGAALVWDLTGTEPRQVAMLQGHAGYVHEVALTPDGRTAVTGGSDQTVRVWDLSGADPRQRDEIRNHDPGVSSLAISPDGKTLSLSGQGGEIRLYDLSTDKPKELPKLTGHSAVVTSLSFSRDGKTLASVSKDRTARLWDMTQSPPVPRTIPDQFANDPLGVGVSPDGKKVVVACKGGTVHLWDLSGAKPTEVKSVQAHREAANSCWFSADGKSYLSTSAGNNPQPPFVAVWWNSADGSKRKEWNLPERSSCGVISPDSRYIALTCHDHNIYILRLPSEG